MLQDILRVKSGFWTMSCPWSSKSPLIPALGLFLLQQVGGIAQPLTPLLGLDTYMAIPRENPLTPEKVELGRQLFFEKQLSADGTLSCASCHDPDQGFTDDKRVAVGVFGRHGTRRVPKLLNRGYGQSFFWDGRIPTLEEQVLMPVVNELEMDLTIEEAVHRLQGSTHYIRAFRQVFSTLPDERSVSHALASYVRTIRSGDAAYDRYLGGAADALDAQQKRGLRIFRTKANCVVCHLGPNFTDEEFHNTGVGRVSGSTTDTGRYQVTGEPGDMGRFKTPTLREVVRTPPYMHDGSLATLKEVIDFYDKGGIKNTWLDTELEPLRLQETEKSDLEAFLETLNGKVSSGY